MLSLLSLILLLILYVLYREMVVKRRHLPPGPRPWPFVGNLFHLQPNHVEWQIAEWSKQYGPVFTLWLPLPNIIVNDYEIMKDTFVKQGDTFAGRPESFIMKHMYNGNFGLVIATGEQWRENRRFSLHVMRDFGFGRKILEPMVLEQARELVEALREEKGPIDVRVPIMHATVNVINLLTFGRAWKIGDERMRRYGSHLQEFLQIFASPWLLVVESLPWTRFLDPPFNLGMSRLKVLNDELVAFFFDQIRIHKETIKKDQPPRDYVDAYLMEIDRRTAKNDHPELFSEWQMMMAIFDMWGAGFDTTVNTLHFAVLFLLNNPDVQRRLQREMDAVIGGEQELTMDDQKRLPYLCATVQEVQRLGNIFPIGLQHTTTEDVDIGEYHVKKGTIVVPQMASVHLDEEHFENPKEFNPDRFIAADGSFVKDERVIPFSMGKRACMGESLARMELFLFLGTLIQRCEFRSEDPLKPPPTDSVFGFLQGPAPYKCCVMPREGN